MATYFKAISAAGDPEFIFYDERCLGKIDPPLKTGRGIKLNTGDFKTYDDCKECTLDNAKNTLFIRYEQ